MGLHNGNVIKTKLGKLRIVTKTHSMSQPCDGCKNETIRTQQMFLGNKPIGIMVPLCLVCCSDSYSM